MPFYKKEKTTLHPPIYLSANTYFSSDAMYMAKDE